MSVTITILEKNTLILKEKKQILINWWKGNNWMFSVNVTFVMLPFMGNVEEEYTKSRYHRSIFS